MKIWKITQNVNNSYDTFDSAIVVAKTEEDAKTIHPADSEFSSTRTWCHVDEVKVEYIGTATKGTKRGVILASFNAG
jgi:hypothetical protein